MFPSDDLERGATIAQGTNEWLEWRRQGIGASDVAAILGVSPWKTARQLWLEKTGREVVETSTHATQRGHWLEVKARAQYELLADCEMPPALVIHPQFPYMRVSLDGWNPELNRVLEIKCPGKADHEAALAGRVPEKYIAQLQFQLFVTGADTAHYFSFDGESGCIVEVKADAELQRTIRDAVIDFWTRNVQQDLEPDPAARDWIHVTEHEAVRLFSEYRRITVEIQTLEARAAELKKEILSRYSSLHPRLKCAGVEMLRSKRAGAVDYSRIPELQNVDLEAYRKGASEVTTLRVNRVAE